MPNIKRAEVMSQRSSQITFASFFKANARNFLMNFVSKLRLAKINAEKKLDNLSHSNNSMKFSKRISSILILREEKDLTFIKKNSMER